MKFLNNYCLREVLLIIALGISVGNIAQPDSADQNLTDTLNAEIDFFSSDKPLRFTLISNFRNFQKEKAKGEYQQAELIYFQGDSNEIRRQVKIKPRGKNRLENCYFPPIKIAFKSSEPGQKQAFNALKMVVKCRDLPKYQNYLLKEFLCYKLYNVLTDTCFNVRLVDFTYVDTGRKKPEQLKMFAFLIEDDKMLANRYNMKLEKQEKLTQRSISQFQIMRLAMFQFMIGNYDWAVPIQQNVRILESREIKRKFFVVPYDFDYSGLVGAEYAIPSELLGIRSVYERIYLGECKPEELFAPIIKLFDLKRDAFYKTILDFEYLDKAQKEQMIRYLEEFYGLIHQKEFYNKSIRKTCKEIK
jgi:hypothetical protein